ncbi:MAG: hypothetical protein Q8N18_16305 [Opitutaceae bacterium]|nr:hypothetical protein [Opitutaceae bacterium]
MTPSRIVFLLLAVIVTAAVATAATLRAGAHATDITPITFPAPINGGMKGASSSTVRDPMHARSLVIESGGVALVLCIVDACMIPREICVEAKRIAARATGIAESRMLISATHAHSCATMTAVFQSDPDPAYVARVPTLIADSIIRAHANLERAEIAWGADRDPTQVFNRRWLVKEGESYENPFDSKADRAWMNPGYQNPKVTGSAGPVDDEVALLAVRAAEGGRPIALLANYSLHYVGGVPAISADYFAAFAREMAVRLGTGDGRYAGKPAFMGAMSNGTSGDINNVNYGRSTPLPRPAPGEQVEVVARSVADAALRAWARLEWRSAVRLASAERDVLLAVRKADAGELARARRLVETSPRDREGQFSDRKAIYAREALLLDDYPERVPVALQAHRIGDLTIAAIPCEVFVEIGLRSL